MRILTTPIGTATPAARRAPAVAIVVAGLVALWPTAALARPALTEDEIVATPGRQVIHLRIQTGCGDLPTDRIELTVPETVIGVVPEAAADWTVETVVEPTDAYDLFGVQQTDRVTAIRWTGSTVPIGQYREFGIAAVFTEEGQVAFPVLQGCGTDEVLFDQVPADGEPLTDDDAVTVTVVPEPPSVDVVALRDALDQLKATVAELRTEVDDARLPRVAERLETLAQRVRVLEKAAGIEPEPSPSPRG